jgi:hypothetical protein
MTEIQKFLVYNVRSQDWEMWSREVYPMKASIIEAPRGAYYGLKKKKSL